MTDVSYEDEARTSLLKGAEILYEAVKTTMGPRGRNVVLFTKGEVPIITHDGVTVAKAVHVKDPKTGAGVEIIKSAADKMNDDVGDGTTTVTVLTYHIMNEAKKLIDEGANPMQLSREIEDALSSVIDYLKKTRVDADDVETLTKIATLSAADEKLGKLIAETVHKVGKSGTISVEYSSKLDTEVETGEGTIVSSGYMSPRMATDMIRYIAEYDNPAVIVVNRYINTFMEILPLLEKVGNEGYDQAVIFANDFGEDAIGNFVLNNEHGKFKTLAIRAPWFDKRQRDILDDIAHATGATMLSDDTVSITQADMTHIGKANKVISTSLKTTITGCGGDVNGYIAELKEKLKNAEGADEEHLDIRIAALAGQVATIRVGGKSEAEIEERKFRVDDAVAAARAALDGGILPGGATVLYRAKVDGTTDGAKVLSNALKQPFIQLMSNSSLDPEVSASKLIDDVWQGINVRGGESVNLLENGIIDPYKVTEQALTTAVSIGVIGMTAGALIVEDNKQ